LKRRVKHTVLSQKRKKGVEKSRPLIAGRRGGKGKKNKGGRAYASCRARERKKERKGPRKSPHSYPSVKKRGKKITKKRGRLKKGKKITYYFYTNGRKKEGRQGRASPTSIRKKGKKKKTILLKYRKGRSEEKGKKAGRSQCPRPERKRKGKKTKKRGEKNLPCLSDEKKKKKRGGGGGGVLKDRYQLDTGWGKSSVSLWKKRGDRERGGTFYINVFCSYAGRGGKGEEGLWSFLEAPL